MPRLHSAASAPPKSSHEPDILLPATPALSEEISNPAPEAVSTNLQPDNSKPGAFGTNSHQTIGTVTTSLRALFPLAAG